MLTFYLCCLIFGGILLGISLFGGHDSGDLEHSTELGMHDAPELDAATDTEIAHIDHFEHQVVHSQTELKDAVKFISFRNIIYFLTFFGLTGTTFTLLSISAFISFLASSSIGALSWIFGYKLFKYLKDSETGKGIETSDLKGKICKITLPVKKEQKGKIIVYLEEQIIELQAIVSEASSKNEFVTGEGALIVDIKDNIAYIDTTDL